jgi:hypothetical protein
MMRFEVGNYEKKSILLWKERENLSNLCGLNRWLNRAELISAYSCVIMHYAINFAPLSLYIGVKVRGV